ncbi:VanW family protein [Ectobacillus ponti]|uniref:VanW family protein n=1 Tax=Ectobacillus ponti TaxID=2961894 RepID=A0AA41X3Y5_9BACI|nr:VanW family protein [Ectobacillus ponti]MCP8968496.1 VanW family protein [Ectobacillus ponti]
MKKRHPLWLFGIVACAALIIFTVQYSVRSVASSLFQTSDGYAAGTAIGSVDVAGLIREQAEQKLSQKEEAWKADAKLYLQYSTARIAVPAAIFAFDSAKSTARIRNGVNVPAAVSLQLDKLQLLLGEQLQPEVVQHLNVQQLQQDLQSAAAQLQQTKTFHLLSYMNQKEAVTAVAESSVSGAGPYGAPLQQWLGGHGTVTVPAHGTVSLLSLAKGSKLDDKALSFVATLLYQTILPTNLQVQERGISTILPAYAQLGTEARVGDGRTDFVFANPNETDYTLQLSLQGGTMTAVLQGMPLPYRYAIDRSEITLLPRGTLVQVAVPNEEHDAVSVERKGADGRKVEVYREIYNGNGALLGKERIAEDAYLPVQAIQDVTAVAAAAAVTAAGQTQAPAASATATK